MPADIKRISLTPTRNESWIIDKFLSAAKTWADHIIVADQGSTDGTWEALQKKPGVIPLRNNSPTYDELHRQRLLIDRARQIQGRRIFIALDADEMISANYLESSEWKQIESAPPGTVLTFRWVNILPGFQQAWIPRQRKRCGYIDDGANHSGGRIHNQRVPGGPDAPVIHLEEVVLLHFQYVVWERMNRKHLWYQAWEHKEHKAKGPLDIFRQYHHMYGSWARDEIEPFNEKWLKGYDCLNVNYRGLECEKITWWEKEVATMLAADGPNHYRKLNIWKRDWSTIASECGITTSPLDDPRTIFEKCCHRLLEVTQDHRTRLSVRCLERLLRTMGW